MESLRKNQENTLAAVEKVEGPLDWAAVHLLGRLLRAQRLLQSSDSCGSVLQPLQRHVVQRPAKVMKGKVSRSFGHAEAVFNQDPYRNYSTNFFLEPDWCVNTF